MRALYTHLAAHPALYVTRHSERAEGLKPGTEGYKIIAQPESSTRDLVNNIENPDNASIIVFKPNRQVEQACKTKGWNLLNPSAELADRVEAKISQTRFLGDLGRYLPSFAIRSGRELRFGGEPVIIQFNHAHSGLGTMFVKTSEEIERLKSDFPDRPMRITRYIEGPVFTSNNIISGDRVLVGSISYQITGLPDFTDNQFATVGNDWGLPEKIMSKESREQYVEIVMNVGKRLAQNGWKGCFGTDCVMEAATGKVYLIEINARQTASVTFESQIQMGQQEIGLGGVTTFEAHLASLLGIKVEEELIPVNFGSRLIRRVSKKPLGTEAAGEVKKLDLEVISFPETNPGEDLLHIRSMNKSFMDSHNNLSDLGKKVASIVRGA